VDIIIIAGRKSIEAYRKGRSYSRSSCVGPGIEDKAESKKMVTEEQKITNRKMRGYRQKRQEGEEKK
jgi:hypothetical protein